MSRGGDAHLTRRWRVDGATALGGAVLLGVTWWMASSSTISSLEARVFRFFNDWPDWLEIPSWPVMQFGAIGAVLAAAVVTYLLWRKWQPSISLFLSGTGAWLLSMVIKELVDRGRPAEYLNDVNLRPAWDGLGYVSGHVGIAVAIALVLTPCVPRPWRITLWALAAATGLLRMYTGAHFPLDIIGGAGMGLATGAAAMLVFGVPGRPLRRA